MNVHQHKADGLVNITTGKNDQEGSLPYQTRQADAGKHHQIHKGDLQNRSERRVACGTIGVVLYPVAHTNHGGYTVNDQHSRTDLQ